MTPYRTVPLVAAPLALIVLLSSVPLVGASPTNAAGSSVLVASGGDQWAYGASLNTSTTWTNASGGYTATLTAYYGWQTILTQTNGTGGQIELEIQRTNAVDYWLTFCKPSCSGATWTGSLTFLAWESQDGFANLTTNGSVDVNGSAVPALALENESDHVRGNVTETVDASYHGVLKIHTAQYYFSVSAASNLSINFTPALGLVPNALSPGLAWNASAAFTAVGGWTADYGYDHVPMAGLPTRLGGPLSGSVSATGNVALQGVDAGPITLKNGVVTTAVALSLTGPFHLYEGILLLPTQADVLGAGGTAWSGYQNDTATSGTAAADFASHQPHLGLLASSTSYAPQPTSQATLVDAGAASAGGSGSIAAASVAPQSGPPTGGAVLQGEPETVEGAQTRTPCLVAGTCSGPEIGPTVTRPSGVIGLLVVGLLVGTLVALAVVVSRRRAVPPPLHPNERLYPVTSPTGPAPLGAKVPPSEEAPADDPLGHLW